jgi:hypothetical protein
LLNKQKLELSKNKALNFNFLTGSLFNIWQEFNEELLKLITNYKSSIIVSNSDKKVDEKLIQDVILNSSDEFILSIMFGRLLRIFSNNNRSNENTYSTNVYVDLGK